jgi:transcriptional regulator with XRE-family HTH domain
MIAEATLLEKMRLRDARAQLGLTQAELARLAGVSWQVVSKSERGGSISITSAWLILNILNERRVERNLPPLEVKSLTWRVQGEGDK